MPATLALRFLPGVLHLSILSLTLARPGNRVHVAGNRSHLVSRVQPPAPGAARLARPAGAVPRVQGDVQGPGPGRRHADEAGTDLAPHVRGARWHAQEARRDAAVARVRPPLLRRRGARRQRDADLPIPRRPGRGEAVHPEPVAELPPVRAGCGRPAGRARTAGRGARRESDADDAVGTAYVHGGERRGVPRRTVDRATVELPAGATRLRRRGAEHPAPLLRARRGRGTVGIADARVGGRPGALYGVTGSTGADGAPGVAGAD